MRSAKLLLLLLLIIALLPYLYTCFYALPFADDFCFGWTASEKASFAHKFLRQYLHWNGRYTSDVLVNLHPLVSGSLFNYQLASFLAILAFPCVVFLFIRQWTNNLLTAIFTSLLMSIFYVCYQPNITEGIYWYVGIANYHLGNIFFILQLTVLTGLLKGNGNLVFRLIISLFLLIISIGFNEISAALIPVYYLAATIYFKSNRSSINLGSKNFQILITHFAVAFIASLFVVFSPGNCMRANLFPNRLNIVHSVFFASLQTVRFISLWSLSVPFVLLSLIVIVNTDKIKAGFIKAIDYKLLLALLLFTVFMGSFLPYMATGILGQHHTINYVFPFFIILWLTVLISLSQKYRLHPKLNPFAKKLRVLALAITAVAVMLFTGNSRKILTDIKSGIFPRYKSEFMQRQSAILSQPLLPIDSLRNIPNTFQLVDVKSDTGWWVDKCMKRYYTETQMVLK
jgi:hypothetical protein